MAGALESDGLQVSGGYPTRWGTTMVLKGHGRLGEALLMWLYPADKSERGP